MGNWRTMLLGLEKRIKFFSDQALCSDYSWLETVKIKSSLNNRIVTETNNVLAIINVYLVEPFWTSSWATSVESCFIECVNLFLHQIARYRQIFASEARNLKCESFLTPDSMSSGPKLCYLVSIMIMHQIMQIYQTYLTKPNLTKPNLI